MSYNVRDDNAIFGANASIELSNGASASTVVKVPTTMGTCGMFGYFGTGSTAGPLIAASQVYCVYLASPSPSIAAGQVPIGAGHVQVLGVQIWYSTAAASGATIAIENCPAGTADKSGSNILSATNYALNTALTTANTPQSLALNANVDNLQLTDGSRINVYTGSTSTASLVNLVIALYLGRY